MNAASPLGCCFGVRHIGSLCSTNLPAYFRFSLLLRASEGQCEPYGTGIVHAPAPPIWHLIFRSTDATLRALGFTQESQRDYPDGTLRGLSICGGKQTKTFMRLITNGPNRSRVKLGTYPDNEFESCTGAARDRLAGGPA